jgi:aspartyl-tRNA(Asn)/glutamyl-tRNA(Gln) amidotransferase subunit A
VATIFHDVDFIVTPMSSMPPFGAEGPMPTEIDGAEVHAGMSVVLAMLANLANLPAISVPAGLVDGVPIGLQVIGPRFREELLLAAAARYEACRPWPRHHQTTTSH